MDQNEILANDPEFNEWLDEQNEDCLESMMEDGFLMEQYDEYEDGRFERQGSDRY